MELKKSWGEQLDINKVIRLLGVANKILEPEYTVKISSMSKRFTVTHTSNQMMTKRYHWFEFAIYHLPQFLAKKIGKKQDKFWDDYIWMFRSWEYNDINHVNVSAIDPIDFLVEKYDKYIVTND